MNAAQDYYPSLTNRSFDDRRCFVGILSHNQPPTCELRAIFPVMLDPDAPLLALLRPYHRLDATQTDALIAAIYMAYMLLTSCSQSRSV